MTDRPTLPSGRWKIDPDNTRLTVIAKKLFGFIPVPASLDVVSGAIDVDESGDVTAVDAVIAAASYDSASRRRDAAITGKRFLAAHSYPTITVASHDVKRIGDDYWCDVVVTVKDQSTPLSLDVSSIAVTRSADGVTGSFRASGTVDRRQVGLDFLPDSVISQALTIRVSANVTSDGLVRDN